MIRLLTYLLALNPSTWSGNSYHFVNLSQKCSALHFPLYPRAVPCSHHLSLVVHKWCHHLWPLVHKRFLPEPLCHLRRNVVPWVKGKKRSFSRLLDDKPHVLPYPYCCGLVELEIPHPRILEATSPTNLSTYSIH